MVVPAGMRTEGTPAGTMTRRFRASAETRMAALRVRLLVAGHQDFPQTIGLLYRMERLGRRLRAPGLIELAVTLRLTVMGTQIA